MLRTHPRLPLLVIALLAFVVPATAQDVEPGPDLSVEQARLADRFERLEMVLSRLAELSASTDPRRARLLREAVAKSREQALDNRFETIVQLLEEERLSAATGRQTDLESELDDLLALLLKADRDRQLDTERKRIKAYLKEVGRMIRLEKGIQARTEGGDQSKRLAQDQSEVAKQTGKLGDSISDEAQQAKGAKSANAKPSQDSNQSKNSDAKPAKPAAESESKPAEPGDSKGSDSQKDSKPSKGGASGKSGQPGDSGESDAEQSEQEPTERAADRLKAAHQAMQEAQKQLDEANRGEASKAQQKAIKQLELAKAELERVLRQMREEEMERTLTLLAARFRKMLEAQTKVYEGTVRLDRVPATERDHDDEIESARLSREESQITAEADRALVLLKEEGSSLAFPETVSLMRDDMQQVTERLAESKVGELTQQLEQDIIEALEETIAALDRALKDLEKKRTPQGQMPTAGQPGEPPLVDKLAELKMIRALQMRINRRTQRYGAMIEGEQADAAELIGALAKLAERQERVYQATHDLGQGRND